VTPGEKLCLACGLCCDGTLFDNVRLEPGDDAKQLKSLGLPVTVSRGKEPVARFPQPCAALCKDRTCRLYAHRPGQCRSYECMVFKRMQAGELAPASALRAVTNARRQADRVRRLLRTLGDTDEQRSLGERFFRMQCRMEEKPAATDALAIFADLSLAVHKLKLLAHAKFFTRPPGAEAEPAP
jgi:Fe-S-cluster containining protein